MLCSAIPCCSLLFLCVYTPLYNRVRGKKFPLDSNNAHSQIIASTLLYTQQTKLRLSLPIKSHFNVTVKVHFFHFSPSSLFLSFSLAFSLARCFSRVALFKNVRCQAISNHFNGEIHFKVTILCSFTIFLC